MSDTGLKLTIMYQLSQFAARNLYLGRFLVTFLSILWIFLGLAFGVILTYEISLEWGVFFWGGLFLFITGYYLHALFQRQERKKRTFIRKKALLAYFYLGVFVVAISGGIQMGNELDQKALSPQVSSSEIIPVNQAPKADATKKTPKFKEKIKQFFAPLKRKTKGTQKDKIGLRVTLFILSILVGGALLYLLAVLACAALCTELALLGILAGLVAPLGALYAMSIMYTSIFRIKKSPGRGRIRFLAGIGYFLIMLGIVGAVAAGVAGILIFGTGTVLLGYAMIKMGIKKGEFQRS